MNPDENPWSGWWQQSMALPNIHSYVDGEAALIRKFAEVWAAMGDPMGDPEPEPELPAVPDRETLLSRGRELMANIRALG